MSDPEIIERMKDDVISPLAEKFKSSEDFRILDKNLKTISVLSSGDSFLHSFLKATDREYNESPTNERIKMVDSFEKELIQLIDEVNIENISKFFNVNIAIWKFDRKLNLVNLYKNNLNNQAVLCFLISEEGKYTPIAGSEENGLYFNFFMTSK